MRAAIFIDGGYLLQHLKTSRIALDYGRFADYVLAPIRRQMPVDLLRCYFYYCAPWIAPEPNEDGIRRMEAHRHFVEEIENVSRWQVRLGKLEKRWDGNKEYFEQKRVDVLLSCDMVRHAASGHIQHAVLVAGDSDFIPAVNVAKESGVTLSLWCGPQNTVHKDLVTLADEVHPIDIGRLPRKNIAVEQAVPTPSVPTSDTATASEKPREATERPRENPRRPQHSRPRRKPSSTGAIPKTSSTSKAEVKTSATSRETKSPPTGIKGGT